MRPSDCFPWTITEAPMGPWCLNSHSWWSLNYKEKQFGGFASGFPLEEMWWMLQPRFPSGLRSSLPHTLGTEVGQDQGPLKCLYLWGAWWCELVTSVEWQVSTWLWNEHRRSIYFERQVSERRSGVMEYWLWNQAPWIGARLGCSVAVWPWESYLIFLNRNFTILSVKRVE